MKAQSLSVTGEKSVGLTVDQLAAFVVDCRGMEERGFRVLEMQGRTTMGGRLWKLTTSFVEQPSAFGSQSGER